VALIDKTAVELALALFADTGQSAEGFVREVLASEQEEGG
jgi:hypothetical protein